MLMLRMKTQIDLDSPLVLHSVALLMLVLCRVGINVPESLSQVHMYCKSCRHAGECILQEGNKLNITILRTPRPTWLLLPMRACDAREYLQWSKRVVEPTVKVKLTMSR